MALPTITCSPDGGRFTADTAVTLTASRPCTIWWSKWPTGTWERTAPGQTSKQVTLTESGPFRFTAQADDTGEFAGYLSGGTPVEVKYTREFIINQPGKPVAVCDWFPRSRYPMGSRITEVNPGDWQTIPGYYSPRQVGTSNSYGGEGNTSDTLEGGAGWDAANYPGESPSVGRWTGDAFGPDQEVIGKNNPPQGGASEFWLARLQPNALTCYGAGIGYIDNETTSGVDPYLELSRWDNGTETPLVTRYALEHRGDNWFHFIRVTGQNPVRVQVGVYLNDDMRPGSLAWGRETQSDWDGDGWRDGSRFGLSSCFVPVPDARPETTFIYIDYLDSSPQRILSGQPGVLIEGAFTLSNFIAREVVPLSTSSTGTGPTTARLSGTRKRGAPVTVMTGPPARPTITNWGWYWGSSAIMPDYGPRILVEGDLAPGTTGLKFFANGVEVPGFSVPGVGGPAFVEPCKDLRGYVRGTRFQGMIKGYSTIGIPTAPVPLGGLTDGTYQLTVKATNAFGESPASDPKTLVFDSNTRALLDAPTITSPAEGASIPAGPVTFSGTAFYMSPVELRNGATPIGRAVSVGDAWTRTLTLAPGAYSVTARAVEDVFAVSPPFVSPARNFTVT
jgi:hypothetical protein